MKKLILIMLGVVFLSGCSGYNSRAELITTDKVDVVDYDASRRGAYIKKDGTIKICAEPAPDVAVAIANQFQFVKGDTQATLNLTESINKIANRSNTLELMREAMYRVCELHFNTAINKTEAKNLLAQIIDKGFAAAVIELGTSSNKAIMAISNSTLSNEQKELELQKISGFNIDIEKLLPSTKTQ